MQQMVATYLSDDLTDDLGSDEEEGECLEPGPAQIAGEQIVLNILNHLKIKIVEKVS